MSRACYLSTVDLYRLNQACIPLREIGDVYLVGSAGERADFRDVDVRMILPDDEFDTLFGRSPGLWQTYCYAVSRWLAADTGLPVDFQVQRMTEANENHSGTRNPLGSRHRQFAALGDATRFALDP